MLMLLVVVMLMRKKGGVSGWCHRGHAVVVGDGHGVDAVGGGGHGRVGERGVERAI